MTEEKDVSEDLQEGPHRKPGCLLLQASPSPALKLLGPDSLRKARCQDPNTCGRGRWQAPAPLLTQEEKSFFSFLLRGLVGCYKMYLPPHQCSNSYLCNIPKTVCTVLGPFFGPIYYIEEDFSFTLRKIETQFPISFLTSRHLPSTKDSVRFSLQKECSSHLDKEERAHDSELLGR